MKYSGIIYNDFSAAPGVCLTFFTQGCPHRCKGCHNPETWSFDSGKEFTNKTIQSILNGLKANGIHRSFCIMGGEPLCPENIPLVYILIHAVKRFCPTNIYIWSGYTYEELKKNAQNNPQLEAILNMTDYLIDGPYKQEQRDITLNMRGSSNQHIIDLKVGMDATKIFETMQKIRNG